MHSNSRLQHNKSMAPHTYKDEESTAPVMPLLASGRKKRWSLGSLFFSLFFFVPLIISRPLPIETWILQSLGYICFVALYIKAINQPVKSLPIYLLLMFLLSVACSFQNPGSATIIGFIAFIVGYYNPLKTGLTSIAAMMLLLVSMHFTMFDDSNFLLNASLLNSIVLFGFGVMERKETLYSLKESKQAETLRVLSAITERERIGRDLHDVAGHALSSISLKAQLADKLIAKNKIEEAHREVKALAHLSQSLLSDIRLAVSDIKQLSLGDEIAKVQALLEDNGFSVSIYFDESIQGGLAPAQENQLALIIKELTTNTLRYSKGNNVVLSLTRTDGKLVITYQDDGKIENAAMIKEGNGLTGIRERAASINAEVDINFTHHPLITLLVTIPEREQVKDAQ
ncbi:sensor histidine kinase [Alteromonas sp. D210916BOD_24]|uniref:sensor histidine kinase n=1 Tax=Alteromonas sp. D210916BOD_24 TaxID=3157618 RepID=UPI00399C6CE3